MPGLRKLLFIGLLALPALGGIGAWRAVAAYHAPGPLAVARAVVIPASGTAAAAWVLAEDNALRCQFCFRAAVWLTRRQGAIHAGEFALRPHVPLAGVLAVLRFAAPVQHRVTIPEGLTGAQIAAILGAAAGATGRIAAPPEGSILPQTYDYVLGAPRREILRRAGLALQARLRAAWARRDPALRLTTPEQAVILASIVQEETPLAAELPEIAAVYENRLALGMRLQADPTVIYAASNGATAAGRPISRADLADPSPYNTYAGAGLPPGPICAPGMAAIEAVLHPAASGALYFVATGAGGHVFSATFAQQMANIAALRR